MLKCIGRMIKESHPKPTKTMIIPTTESTLRMTLMQLSETKLELTAVTEQRDRLAEALRIIADGTSCRECGGEDQALLAREALQSITPNAEPC